MNPNSCDLKVTLLVKQIPSLREKKWCHKNPPTTLDDDSSSSDEDKTKHLLRQALKRQRRRSCSVSVTILNCSTSGEDSSSSSGGETIYSAQGYETAAIRDEGDSSDEEDSDESRSDTNVASSPVRRQEDDYDYGEENVYRVTNFWKGM